MTTLDLERPESELGRQHRFELRFPDVATLGQDEEWCEVKLDGAWKRVRFHDYHEIFSVPGLYESLFYRTLRCSSPTRVASLLDDVLRDADQAPQDLRVLDVGAGNGMVGAALQDIGVAHVAGIDIIPEARDATERDRPWAYDAYHVADLTDLDEKAEEEIRRFGANCVATVAALGFGDIPDAAFLRALDLIETPGLVAFNIKEQFVDAADSTGFAALIERLKGLGVLRLDAYRRYCHRLSISGEPLHYVAVVATKLRDVPDELFQTP